MLRLTRPLFQRVLKKSTGITGLSVHPNPLPELIKTYEHTLSLVASFPSSSIYRQSVEALTQKKLNIVKGANGDVSAAEAELKEGQIEESLDIASDELNLVSKMAEWRAYVISVGFFFAFISDTFRSWEPLQEKPPVQQWEYFWRSSSS
jgi:NADH dehydrogenase (ubiquinone) 1 alpha subcomplex subunit 5